MKVKINNKYYTDNSNELDKDCIFIKSINNEKFIKNIKEESCKKIIDSSYLKDEIDLSGIKIIGITGTNGKTTSATAIYETLLNMGYKVSLQGTMGFYINGEKLEDYSLTTPVQLTNFYHIYKAIQNECDFFIMEVSSHAIDQNRIEGLNFALKIHTNITRDHLDYHKTIEEYIEVKNSFLSDESLKLVNIDDKVVKYNFKNAYTYSVNNSSNYKINKYEFNELTGVNFIYKNKEYSFLTPLKGIFNIYNLMDVVAGIHLLTNKNLNIICKNIEKFLGVSGRMEIVNLKPLVIVDFAHTPDGMEEVLKSFTHQDIICVFGAGGNRDKNKRPLMGKVASKYSKHIIVTSDNPRFEEPEEIIKDILVGIENRNNVDIVIDRSKAIQKAFTYVDKNSVLLVLGKGDEPNQLIKGDKIPFDDKKEIFKNL